MKLFCFISFFSYCSPPSPIAPELTSPLPLEATPLPPSLPSPVSLTALENGLDMFTKEVEDNMFIKMLQQQVGIKESGGDGTAKDAKETSKEGEEKANNKEKDAGELGEELGKTQDLGLPTSSLDGLKELDLPKAKKVTVDASRTTPTSSDLKVQPGMKNSEKIKEQERPKLQESVKSLPVQAIPLPISMSLSNGSGLPSSGVTINAAPRSSISNLEALVNFLHRPDSNVKMVPAVKVLSVESGKEAVIPVQDKNTTTSILASLQNIVQESTSSLGPSAPLVTTHSNAASLPVPVTCLPMPSAAVFTVSTAPVVATVVSSSVLGSVPKSVPNSVAASVQVTVPAATASVPNFLSNFVSAPLTVPAPVAHTVPAKGPSVEKEISMEIDSKETRYV